MEAPQVAVAVIVMKDSALLLGRDVKTKQWTLPKGIVAKFQKLQVVGQNVVYNTTNIIVQVTGSIFVSEEIIPPDHHQIIVVTLGKPLGVGQDLIPVCVGADAFSEAKWIDFRELSVIQADVDDITVDSIMKFGLYLQSKARGA